MNDTKGLLRCIYGLTIWRGIRADETIAKFEELLKAMDGEDCDQMIDVYHSLLHIFMEQNKWGVQNFYWADYIMSLVALDENFFSLYAERVDYFEIPREIIELANRDLELLYCIANISWTDIEREIEARSGYRVGTLFKEGVGAEHRDKFSSKYLANYYRENGCGELGIYRGFRWRREADGVGYLEGIDSIDPIGLDDLIGYEIQKERIIANTELLLSGYSANNILLYGDKGTGKSSMVRAVLNEFYHRGLRIVEVPKECLGDYYEILSLLEHRGQKFIIFVDDLSFEDTEPEYKNIKALLEGGLKERPQNIVIYATSNRRHLIKQSFDDREEITPADAIQEKLSLSDRFGITLTFLSPSQKEYIEIVKSIAKSRNLDVDSDELIEEALIWGRLYNGTSGRTARQFIDHIEGSLGLK